MTAPLGWRERWARRLPAAVLECPFECLMSLLATLTGISCMLGALEPGSLLALLPSRGVAVWGGALFLGGVTIASGLYRKTFPIRMAIGLRLVGVLFGAYAIAVVASAGVRTGGASAAVMSLIASLCFFRAFFLRATAEAAVRVSTDERSGA